MVNEQDLDFSSVIVGCRPGVQNNELAAAIRFSKGAEKHSFCYRIDNEAEITAILEKGVFQQISIDKEIRIKIGRHS